MNLHAKHEMLLVEVDGLKAEIARLTAENDRLRLRIQSAAGDDLCRLTQEEIKAYTSGTVKIPPKKEFIASCERFHEQISSGPGVLTNCLTLAQLIAENERYGAALHANRCHPDYQYLVVPKDDRSINPEALKSIGGWEPNPEYQAAPGYECWRRRIQGDQK